MTIRKKLIIALAAMFPAAGISLSARTVARVDGVLTANTSGGSFAPYFIGSLNGGRMVRAHSLLGEVSASVASDSTKRLSWGAGADILAGYSSANEYALWNESAADWTSQTNRPSPVWVQQLYASARYRGVELIVGQHDHHSALLDETLTSGDLTRSGNARGIPGISLGFKDFQDIPFTHGWLQIDGVVEYGRFTDDGFKEHQYNRYNWMTTTDVYYTYKRCYFRTRPSAPLSITLGMQTAGQFGGSTFFYRFGHMYASERRGFRLKDVFKMLLPLQGNGNAFYEGNSLGSWDFKASYRLPDGETVSFAFQWPWEDGSGIGRRNGTDGLWGIYYHANRRQLISGAALEWLDFRNQSGPIHWAPGDMGGTTIGGEATGGDNYYNNDTYTAYTNYGMAIATPFLVAPIYNLNGYPAFLHNCARGIHAAVKGSVSGSVDYVVKYSWQQAWGMGRTPSTYSSVDNSFLVEAVWHAGCIVPGVKIRTAVAYDTGSLRGNNFGTLAAISWTGNINLERNN